METVADKSAWVEDAALGVAVREAGGELQVKPINTDGRRRVYDVLKSMYGADFADWPCLLEVYRVCPAHRLAFARALGLESVGAA